MADPLEKRKKEIAEAMSRERGYMPEAWAYMAEKDLDFIEAYNNLYLRALTDGKALPIKTRELIAMALLAYRGLTEAVFEHGKRALKHGATKQELLEAIETTLIPGGAPTFGTGLKALMMIEEAEKKEK
jgi:alkylhydroperoxidase/carboxymuconolactone decarboxylase family protein YurZ